MKTLNLAAAIALIPLSIFAADPDPRSIVAKSIANYETDWKAALDYTYTERDVTIDMEGHATTSELSQVSVINGTPYSRVVARNGRPLTAEESRKEEEKYQKAVATREAESPEQRARRVLKYENERRFLGEISNAFEMKLIGHETIEGRANYVIALTPKPAYVAQTRKARIFHDVAGTLWIDERDIRWSKAEATVTNTISFGWVLARVEPGAHISMTQLKVDGEHWMPKTIDIKGTARILLVKNRKLDQSISFSDYKHVANGPTAIAAKTP